MKRNVTIIKNCTNSLKCLDRKTTFAHFKAFFRRHNLWTLRKFDEERSKVCRKISIERLLVQILIAVLAFAFMGTSGAAEESELDDYGQSEIAEALPDEARDTLEENGIEPDNSGALNLSVEGVLSYIWDIIKDKATKPLQMLCSMCGVVLFCALAESIAGEGSLKGVFSVVGVLCGAGIAASSVCDLLDQTLNVLSISANLMTILVPVVTAISAALGHITTASAVNTVALAATQVFSQLSVNFLAPLCCTVMGVSIAGAVHPQMKLDSIAELIKKIAVWGLGLLTTIFMSILSVQTLVASSADNTAIKTAKFMVSQGVPIVGGTVSDAVNTISGGLVLLKSSIGTYGIIAMAVITLPVIVTLFCYKFSMFCAQTAAEMFSLKELASFFKSCCSVITVVIAVTFCFLLFSSMAVLLLIAAANGGNG